MIWNSAHREHEKQINFGLFTFALVLIFCSRCYSLQNSAGKQQFYIRVTRIPALLIKFTDKLHESKVISNLQLKKLQKRPANGLRLALHVRQHFAGLGVVQRALMFKQST